MARPRTSTSPRLAGSGRARWSTRSRPARLASVTGILHIGIGGSVLGPHLLVDALGRRRSKLNVRFLSNIDGGAFEEAVAAARPGDDA